MVFVFQQPSNPNLLDTINAAAHNADGGGGVFAFASKDGVEALFACPNLANMMVNKKPFQLVVGIDAITNAETLLCISEKLKQFAGMLTANVFFHKKAGSIFHPKFLWFQQGKTLRLLTGSGNLTQRGLGKAPAPSNWEAFGVQDFGPPEAQKTTEQINAWLTEQRKEGTLRSLEDEDVVNKAMVNGQLRFNSAKGPRPATAPRRTTRIPVEQPDIALEATLVGLATPDILIREVPRNRPGQADVGQAALTEFFGYEGSAKDIYIQHVSDANVLGEALKIRLFVNQSRNYRLELSAITDFPYEAGADDSRMLLLASRLDSRSYRYLILPITHAAYNLVARLLGPIPANSGTGRAMREKRVSPRTLLEAWPQVPGNLLPVDLELSEF